MFRTTNTVITEFLRSFGSGQDQDELGNCALDLILKAAVRHGREGEVHTPSAVVLKSLARSQVSQIISFWRIHVLLDNFSESSSKTFLSAPSWLITTTQDKTTEALFWLMKFFHTEFSHCSMQCPVNTSGHHVGNPLLSSAWEMM